MIGWLAGLGSLVMLALVLQDAFEVMLLPRRVQRRWRFTRGYFRYTWSGWNRLARLWPPGSGREGVLSHFGALSMLGLFALWSVALIVAFGTLEWVARGADGSDWAEHMYMSGVTFFTLGYGDVVPHTAAARFLAVLEAGTGIGFIAIVIGYLPVLYQLFARREAHVIQLDARAGSPPAAVVMLCRHSERHELAKLDELLREWEVWGSELLESHLSYPMLAYYRSQHDNQSWLGAVAAIMDCCALILIGVTDIHPLQARMTFTMARQVLVEMARSFRVGPVRGVDRLDGAGYARLEAEFAGAHLRWEGGAEAELTLRALRGTYEPLLEGLARHLLIVLPGWLEQDGSPDHWELGHRGTLARQLVEQLSERGVSPAAGRDGPRRPGR